ncbi:transforming growth factor beta-1-induced transcript 1 protein-like isoform X2 [Caloenas nicobarica]|uniref:transforming growth factor beta-1-induced transcript 1 protein-like isoform X2 n=1 Tax=Caloenas nicobarica TaxID=187106 RepID=UPI0032B793CF
MEDLDALLADLEMTSRLARPPSPPGGDIPPPRPPPPYGHVPGGDTEQLYSSVWRPRPPRAPPALGQLERLLRDLDGTQGGTAAELQPHVPPTKTPELPPPPSFGASPPRNLGAPPTSATQELDRLMASLADFNLHPPPPQKTGVPAGGNLEELLVTLEQDLTRRGVPTQDKGVCGGCRQPIVGKEVVTALGHTWHPQHFCCAHCGKPLGDQGFLEQDGRPFCPHDFSRLFSPRCLGCSGPVLAEFVAAMGGLWHPRCFVCQECSSPFPSGTFFEDNGRPVCERHRRVSPVSPGSPAPGPSVPAAQRGQ